jgi:hypothetical protein
MRRFMKHPTALLCLYAPVALALTHSTQCRAYASAHLLQTVGSRMNSFCFESVHNDKATHSSQVTTATIPGAPCHVVATLRRFNKMRSPTPRGLGAVPLPSARARHRTKLCPCHLGKWIMLVPHIPMMRSCSLSEWIPLVTYAPSPRAPCARHRRPLQNTAPSAFPACPCPLQRADRRAQPASARGRRRSTREQAARCKSASSAARILVPVPPRAATHMQPPAPHREA